MCKIIKRNIDEGRLLQRLLQIIYVFCIEFENALEKSDFLPDTGLVEMGIHFR